MDNTDVDNYFDYSTLIKFLIQLSEVLFCEDFEILFGGPTLNIQTFDFSLIFEFYSRVVVKVVSCSVKVSKSMNFFNFQNLGVSITTFTTWTILVQG